MEDSTVTTGDTGQTSPESGALDPPSNAAPALILPSLPLSAPPLPSSQPPSRPSRPKPLPVTVKPSLLPSRPPLPPSTPPSLPPPLPPVSKPLAPLFSNNPPPTLPPPLSPTPVSPTPSPLLTTATPAPVSSDSTPCLPPPLNPTVSLSSALPPSLLPPSCLACPALSPTDCLVQTTSVWKPKGLSKTKTRSILEKEMTGAFMVHGTEDGVTELSVRLPDEDGIPLVQNLTVKQHKTFLHLDGSTLVFDDIFKLVSFYCVSRDILPVPLRLPQVVTMATRKEELEVVSALGAEFWTSDLNQQPKNQDLVLDPNHKDQSSLYVYINPVPVEENVSKEPQQPAVIKVDISSSQNIVTSSQNILSSSQNVVTSSQNISSSQNVVSSSLQNGEMPVKVSPEVKGRSTSHQETSLNKYKRPPPRPPSLGSASGMGLLFSSSSVQSSSSVAVERKEEGKRGGGGTEERKTTSTSPPPLRPPIPAQSRAAPRLPPAPLRRNSSQKSSDRERAQATEGEKEHNSAREGTGARGEEMTGSQPAPVCERDGQDGHQEEEEEMKRGRRQSEKEVKDEKEVTIDPEGNEDKQKPGVQTQPLVKRPSRPVPPPRRKPCAPEPPVCPSQAAGGPASQKAGMRVPPPSPARRPDVSLYSPQGGTALGTDPDSCSTSSTEEEGEPNQEQVQNHNHCAGSRSPKAAVKRTPTTIMLDRARYRLSTVLTSLISHDRRLTQRIVELARDPTSYFGNLVKEHRAFTLDTMSHHSSSTELLQEIRQMMTQLKSYLLQSTELQVMLEPQHQYTQEKLDSIVEAALCKSVLKPLREPIYQSLEKLHENDSSLKKLTQNQSVVLGSTTTALGVTTAVPEAPAMEKISIKLSNLHLDYSPQKKIELLLKACKIIYDSMSVSCPGRAHGADDFLPVMMYVLARSNLVALQLDVEYMMELMDPSLTLGEGSYYLTTTYGALEHIKSFDQQRSATRQLSREVQDSIHRWERRRTLNQERMAHASVRDFLTVCCPEMGINPKTLGILPTTTVQQLSDQCAARFEQDSYTLSVYTDGVLRPLALTDLALSVKNSLQPGAYCFVYHPANQGDDLRCHSGPCDPPPGQPAESCRIADAAAGDSTAAEEESLISL